MTDAISTMNSENNPENALAVHDEKLNSIAGILLNIADETQDEELQNKLIGLAEQTSPAVKGIDTPSTRAKIPILQLRQAMTQEDNVPLNTKAGQMYTTSGVLIGDTLTIIPIYTHNIRKKWGEDKIECMSLDGQTGNRYGECRKCPYGQFERGVRPECSPGTSYFFITEDMSNIYQVDFTKTSAAAGKKIRTLALPPALWSRTYVLGTEKQQQQSGSKGTYYVYTVRSGTKVPAETQKICDILFDYFHANHKKAVILLNDFARRNALNSGAGEGALPANGESVPVNGKAVNGEETPNTDALDFSESM